MSGIDVEPGPFDKSRFEVSKNDQIASTRSFSTSRRRQSSRIQNLSTDVSFRNLRLLSIGQFEHG